MYVHARTLLLIDGRTDAPIELRYSYVVVRSSIPTINSFFAVNLNQQWTRTAACMHASNQLHVYSSPPVNSEMVAAVVQIERRTPNAIGIWR